MSETVHCLKCNHKYEQKKNEFIKICPKCSNDDLLETVYITTDNE